MSPFFNRIIENTPQINFDIEKGILEISGRSILENPTSFYKPFIDGDLEKYLETPKQKTLVNIKMEYFNSGSAKWILHILKKLETLLIQEKQVEINWFYADEDTLEAGEELEALVDISFNMIMT